MSVSRADAAFTSEFNNDGGAFNGYTPARTISHGRSV